MLIEDAQSRLCGDLVVAVDDVGGRSVVVTSMSYPNGDSVNLYFESVGDVVAVTDEGGTLSFLHHQGVELTAERRDMIRRMCRASGVDFLTPVIRKEVVGGDLGAAAIAVCEAVTRVAAIWFHAAAAARSPLPVAVRDLLRARVEPTRGVERDWIFRRHDHKGAYPVDFHVNGVGRARNIFSVTSSRKAVMVTAVVHFLRSHGVSPPTLTIVDPAAELGKRDVYRVQSASTEMRFGLDGHEEDVVKFALDVD